MQNIPPRSQKEGCPIIRGGAIFKGKTVLIYLLLSKYLKQTTVHFDAFLLGPIGNYTLHVYTNKRLMLHCQHQVRVCPRDYALKLASNCCNCVMPRSSPFESTAVPTACTECSRGFMLSNPNAC